MKVVVVRLAIEDEGNVMQILGSLLNHVYEVRGAAIVGGDASTILVSAARNDTTNGVGIAELLAGNDGTVEPA